MLAGAVGRSLAPEVARGDGDVQPGCPASSRYWASMSRQNGYASRRRGRHGARPSHASCCPVSTPSSASAVVAFPRLARSGQSWSGPAEGVMPALDPGRPGRQQLTRAGRGHLVGFGRRGSPAGHATAVRAARHRARSLWPGTARLRSGYCCPVSGTVTALAFTDSRRRRAATCHRPRARSAPSTPPSSLAAAGSRGSCPAIPSRTADTSAPACPLAAQCSSEAASAVVRCAA